MRNIKAVSSHLQRLRSVELDLVRHFFKPMDCVLELGGGNGFQAKKISEFKCNVHSIDIKNRTNKSIFFDVMDYDGKNIPFESAKFDILFTSNVLEHVVDIDNILTEIKRVLKPGGIAICIMPTPSWRFWSIISHYPYLIGAIVKRLILGGNSLTGMMKIVPPPHGEYKSSFAELYYYSQWNWTKLFNENSLQVIECYPTGVFCTLYAIFPNLGINARRVLSNFLGSAGNIYIVKQE